MPSRRRWTALGGRVDDLDKICDLGYLKQGLEPKSFTAKSSPVKPNQPIEQLMCGLSITIKLAPNAPFSARSEA